MKDEDAELKAKKKQVLQEGCNIDPKKATIRC